MTAVDEKRSFQEKKKEIAPANYTAEVVCNVQITPEECLNESEIDFLIIFVVARFERNFILHTAGEW